jgi:hypothetical protein
LDNLIFHWFDGIALGFIGVLFLGLLVPLIYGAKDRMAPDGVLCPECRKPLFGATAQAAIDTGVCVYCGEKILDGASPTPPRSGC